MKSQIVSKLTVLASFAALLAAVELGGAGGCGGGGSSGTTRNMSGTVSSSSLAGLSVRSRSQAGLVLKNQVDSCSDLQFCCFGYDGDPTVVEIGDDCEFDIDLDLETFCFCGFFSGDDSDGDDCNDDYVAEVGCSDNGYSGTIPIFADDDGGTDSIDLGTITIEGDSAIPENDPCAVVDSDDDGTSDEGDTDDDGDGELDTDDFVCGGGCDNAAEYDEDDNDIPDIFEDDWDDLDDDDGDDIPDFCDVEEDCDPDAEDADGDCLDDSFSEIEEDDDGDGLEAWYDCDDDDPTVTYCEFEDLTCEDVFGDLDIDGDGVSFCDDCDDFDSGNDLTIDECEAETFSCDLGDGAECGADFECQLFADDEIAAGNDICGGGALDCMTCIDGCCTE